jgi:hypothetical protein
MLLTTSSLPEELQKERLDTLKVQQRPGAVWVGAKGIAITTPGETV